MFWVVNWINTTMAWFKILLYLWTWIMIQDKCLLDKTLSFWAVPLGSQSQRSGGNHNYFENTPLMLFKCNFYKYFLARFNCRVSYFFLGCFKKSEMISGIWNQAWNCAENGSHRDFSAELITIQSSCGMWDEKHLVLTLADLPVDCIH